MQPVSLLFHDVYVSDVSESGFNSPAADRYKLSLREFDAQTRVRRVQPVATEAAKVRGATGAARLTFDDGGVSFYTIVADKLEARGLHAYCFVTTDFIGTAGLSRCGADARARCARPCHRHALGVASQLDSAR